MQTDSQIRYRKLDGLGKMNKAKNSEKGCVGKHTYYDPMSSPNYDKKYTEPYTTKQIMYSNTRYLPDELPTNIVRDYNKVQGVTHPSDNHVEIIRDINYRYVSIENSSNRPIAVNISRHYAINNNLINFIIPPGQIKQLSINSQGGPAQFITLLNPYDGKIVSEPYIFSRKSNSFVLRDGINKWWVQEFTRPSYNAPH